MYLLSKHVSVWGMRLEITLICWRCKIRASYYRQNDQESMGFWSRRASSTYINISGHWLKQFQKPLSGCKAFLFSRVTVWLISQWCRLVKVVTHQAYGPKSAKTTPNGQRTCVLRQDARSPCVRSLSIPEGFRIQDSKRETKARTADIAFWIWIITKQLLVFTFFIPDRHVIMKILIKIWFFLHLLEKTTKIK